MPVRILNSSSLSTRPRLSWTKSSTRPELLAVIKRRVDRDDAPGQYFLTGSQNLALLRDVSESLAGRVVVLDLGPLTLSERQGWGNRAAPVWLELLLNAGGTLPDLHQQARVPHIAPLRTVFEVLWRGGYPRTLDQSPDVIVDIMQSYVRTYVERDVRSLASVQEPAAVLAPPESVRCFDGAGGESQSVRPRNRRYPTDGLALVEHPQGDLPVARTAALSPATPSNGSAANPKGI